MNTTVKLKPFGNRFTAVELEDNYVMDNTYGFLVSNKAYSKPKRVKVLELSDSFDNNGLDIKVGDEVLIPKSGCISYKILGDDAKYQLCNRLDVIGIV